MAHCWKGTSEKRFRFYYPVLVMIIASWIFTLPRTYGESLATLTEGADRVVMAIPVQKVSFWQGGLIKTRALLKVERVIAGASTGGEISILYDGGAIGPIGLKVSHGVTLPAGQKSVLFLVDDGDHYSVFHDAAGIFFVRSFSGKEVVISQDSLNQPGVSIKGLRHEGDVWREGEGIPLSTFLSRIHSLWGKRP